MKLETSNFTAIYEQGTIRYIKSGNVEIIRMIYAAVRDPNWGTLEPKILKETITRGKDGFEINLSVEYKNNQILFKANYSITGKGNQLQFEMDGKAFSSFQTNRIGFCVLHPIRECEGKICTVYHADNSCEDVTFPRLISPHQPMMDISGLAWKPATDIHARLSFFGDVFEMEDQRNWTDASYKTYSRPLKLPFPYDVSIGEKVQQKVILEIQNNSRPGYKENSVAFRIDETSKFKLPEIGTCSTSRREPLELPEAEILKQIPLKHIRGEIKLFEDNWKATLNRTGYEAKLLNLPLFFIVYLSDNYKNEMHRFIDVIGRNKFPVKYILLVGRNHLFEYDAFKNSIHELREYLPGIQMGAGVNAYFAELNRNRTISPEANFVNFTASPQVHAFDNTTLTENIEGLKYAVESAKALFPQFPVFVSPVTLRQRFNVVATSGDEYLMPDQLPAQVDVRQNTVFAAKWLLCSIKYLSQAEANLATFFETVGWRGLIQGAFESPIPGKFKAQTNEVFPVYNILKELNGFESVLYSESKLPLEVDGIVLQNQDKVKLILANFTGNAKIIEIQSSTVWREFRTFQSDLKIKINKTRIVLPPEEIVISEQSW